MKSPTASTDLQLYFYNAPPITARLAGLPGHPHVTAVCRLETYASHSDYPQRDFVDVVCLVDGKPVVELKIQGRATIMAALTVLRAAVGSWKNSIPRARGASVADNEPTCTTEITQSDDDADDDDAETAAYFGARREKLIKDLGARGLLSPEPEDRSGGADGEA